MNVNDARNDVNERLLNEMAEKVSRVMQVSHGMMAGWSPETIRTDLRTALQALAAYPDSEQTHGLISLARMPGSPNDFMVRLNLGVLMHFPTEPEPEWPVRLATPEVAARFPKEE